MDIINKVAPPIKQMVHMPKVHIPTFNNNTTLVIIGIVLIIIISILFYNLYDESSEDSQGNKLSMRDTLKNMCGIYPLIHRTIKKSVSAI